MTFVRKIIKNCVIDNKTPEYTIINKNARSLWQNLSLQNFFSFRASQITLNNIYNELDLIITISTIFELPITIMHVLKGINFANVLTKNLEWIKIPQDSYSENSILKSARLYDRKSLI